MAFLMVPWSGCLDGPPVDEGLAPEATSVVSGDAVILVPIDAPHPVVLFLTAIDPDGSPQDTPTDITVIPADQLGESDGSSGTVRTGPFVFPAVPAGYYVVTGLVDVDENFNPLVASAAVPSEADLLGGYVDVTTGQLAVVAAVGGEDQAEINVLFTTPASTSEG